MQSLNLSSIRQQVMREQRLTMAEAVELEREYRRYLHLLLINQGTTPGLTPSILVDAFLHVHMESAQFASDCQLLGITRLDHFTGERTQQTMDKTVEQYAKTFGVQPPRKFWEMAACCGCDCYTHGLPTSPAFAMLAMLV